MLRSPVDIDRLEKFLSALLRRSGLRAADARAVAWVYRTMTLRGVGHHDVTDFPNLLAKLAAGTFTARPRIATVVDRQAVAVMDGDGAPGALSAYRMTELAIRKARRYGLGFVTLRNSNHFIGAAAYTLLAAERGLIGLALSNTVPGMGSGRSRDAAIGNNPWGFAVQTGAGWPLLLDMCNAYASYGKLHEFKKHGWKIPPTWGLDRRRRPTTDPVGVLDGGLPLPLGDHKGFALAILVELLTSVLSGGAMLDEVSLSPTRRNGSCQAALVIDPRRFLTPATFAARSRKLVRKLQDHPPLKRGAPLLLPGQRSHLAALKIHKDGVRLSRQTLAALNGWAARLHVEV